MTADQRAHHASPGAPDGPARAGAAAAWSDACLAAALFAVDPIGTGGLVVRAQAGPVRDRWLSLLRSLLTDDAPVRKVPLHTSDERLLGGLDLAATLRAGRPVAERGLLAEADGGVVLMAMAERLTSSTAARITAALDTGLVLLERDGLAHRLPARFGVVALDEGLSDDEQPPAGLLERLAIHLDLADIGLTDLATPGFGPRDTAAGRARLGAIAVGRDTLAALCRACIVLGVRSERATILALRVARCHAALCGRTMVEEQDAAAAGRLVIAARATRVPVAEPQDAADPGEPDAGNEEQPSGASDSDADTSHGDGDGTRGDLVLAASAAAIPAKLLDRLRLDGSQGARSAAAGRAGARRRTLVRGRPAGVKRGDPKRGARLNLLETLRAAAPWQRLRQSERDGDPVPARSRGRLQIRRDDFRIHRLKQRGETATIFVVDASGSSALHRLAEAKGAIELLLADCYVRRDHVALVSFRGREAQILLPPTRSLVRAKRCLADLPGGGGTPLAAGLDAALALADAARRKGQTPSIVLMTDGRANIARDGQSGRDRAREDALTAAELVSASAVPALLVDTSPRRQPFAERLSRTMNARYLPLPHADARRLSSAVLSAGES